MPILGVIASSNTQSTGGGGNPGVSPDTVSNLVSWFDANDAQVNIDQFGNYLTSSWNCKVGSPYLFGNIGNPPVKGTGQNSKPKVTFTSAKMWTENWSGAAHAIGNNDDVTIFYVGTVGFGRGWDGHGAEGWSMLMTPSNGITAVLMNSGAAGYGSGSTSAFQLGVFCGVVNQETNNSSLYWYGTNNEVLGSLTGINNNRLRDSSKGWVAGAIGNDTGYNNGDLYEIVVYNRVLTQTERENVTAWLKTKYAL